MELRQLKYFHTLAIHKNYSIASELLYITQPTLTWNIKSLEEELSTRLFFPTRSGIELTQTGNLLLKYSDQIFELLNQLDKEISTINNTDKEDLRIGIASLFTMMFMEEIVEFINDYPNINLSFYQEGSRMIQEMVVDGRVDIGVLSSPIYESDLEVRRIKSDRGYYIFNVVMRDDHFLSKNKTISMKDLKNVPLSSFTSDFILYNFQRERALEYGYEPNIVFENNNWEVLLKNVRSKGTVCLMPDFVQKQQKTPGLTWIPLKDKANGFHINIATRKDELLTPSVLDFVSYFKV